jgi:hypothetical protein
VAEAQDGDSGGEPRWQKGEKRRSPPGLTAGDESDDDGKEVEDDEGAGRVENHSDN